MRKPTTTRLVVAWIRRVWVASGALVLLLMPVYVWWTYTPRLPVDALSSDATVSVERSDVLRFVPRGRVRSVGLVWVAGCLVSPDAYAPLGHAVAAQGGVAAQVWSLGHRNPLGIDFDAAGRLWAHEMGPAHGDELNLIERGSNYGYPIVSNGDHYDGRDIPDHATRPEFHEPAAYWVPAISPAGFAIYDGDLFKQWQGSAFIGGLSSKALVRVEFAGDDAREVERFDMKRRIREVRQGPDGALWLLEDGSRGRLLRLTPR